MSFGGALGMRLLVPLQIANYWKMNNLSAVGQLLLHHVPGIWSYVHLKYGREKSAGNCSICSECFKGSVKKQFVIMGIKAWYWFHKGKQKQKHHGEYDHITVTSGIDVLCIISELINRMQNKILKRMHHWFSNKCSEMILRLHHVSKLGSFCGGGVEGVVFSLLQFESLTHKENVKKQLLSVCPGSLQKF